MREHLDTTGDFRKVKKYVLARCGGIGSLPMPRLGCTTKDGMAA